MDSTLKVVNGKLICLKQSHNEAIEMIIMDDSLPLLERLLCQKCLKVQDQSFKYIRIEAAQEMVKLKLQKLEQKNTVLTNLVELSNEMINIRLRVIQQIDEILQLSQEWIKGIQNREKISDNFLQNFISLSSEDSHQKDFLVNLDSKIQNLMKMKDYETWYKKFKEIVHLQTQQSRQDMQSIIQEYNPIDNKIKMINSVKQEKGCFAIAFNNSGSIMVSGDEKDIKVWQFEKGKITEKKTLSSHSFYVLCIVFSKKQNWFASGSYDNTIRCWKEQLNQDWTSIKPEDSHIGSVYCLILNKAEDQLLSSGSDNVIKVWKVNCKMNQINFDYTLENKHTNIVYSISFNEQETALVSCGRDKKIIVWSKQQNTRWEYMHELTMNTFGFRICFISENRVAWQQSNLGTIHLFELKNKQLIKREDWNLNLNDQKEDDSKFPIIINKNKQVVILKHNRYVYIFKYDFNGQLSNFTKPIDCSDKSNFGSLTEDGQYFAVWNAGTKEIKIYDINYN